MHDSSQTPPNRITETKTLTLSIERFYESIFEMRSRNPEYGGRGGGMHLLKYAKPVEGFTQAWNPNTKVRPEHESQMSHSFYAFN